jgi:uncharacterized membrane protein
MATVLIALGAVIIGATAFVTATRYRELPERVPIHFGITGAADSFGPRPVIWLLVAVQLTVAATFAVAHASGAPNGALVMADSMIAIFWFAQVQIIEAATSGKNRIDMLRFWPFFAVMLAIGVTATRYLR